ncbi:hypothetical protein OPKNFCMD_2690 [Methylobacterium crusticola]|uniref:Glycosyl transferase n=2 Tax=Methylobacterium crusticola TaxID=1697972 RepID=A0ABQ4QZ59_9HYPH|nr:hypothetical protein OPKNFCMD_2690 [Methylobacterium crusticola]
MGPGAGAATARMGRGVPVDRRIGVGAVLVLAGTLAGTGLVAAWLAVPPTVAGTRTVARLAPAPLSLPSGWFVRPGSVADATPDRLDLAIPWGDLVGGSDPTRMRVTVTRAPETEAPLSPARRYARFLTAETQPQPEGLMRRRFRAGTPFEGEDLYLAQADGSRFAARCATGSVPDPEAACLSEVRVGNLSLRLRFAADRLSSWSAALDGLERIFAASP